VSDKTWLAAFVHPQHPWRDFEHTFTEEREYPPASIRRPASLAGMSSVDVYLLSDSAAWPVSSVFTYTESLIGEPSDHLPAEFGIEMPPAGGISAPA